MVTQHGVAASPAPGIIPADHRPPMDTSLFRRRLAPGALGVLTLWFATVAVGQAQPGAATLDLDATLTRVSARVEEYFRRAQSLVCTETASVQNLNYSLSGEGPGRTVESELRLSWEPAVEGEDPPEAQFHRRVTKVNGRRKRDKDKNHCTSAERHDTETQPLSMLLVGQRHKFTFTVAKPARLDGRAAITVEFKERKPATGDISVAEDDDTCLSYRVDGGSRGRIWIDAESFDVLRLDLGLGAVELKMPEKLLRRPGVTPGAMLERFDSTTRFKRFTFSDPEEQLVLPSSSTQLFVTRGSSPARMRTSITYSGYKRFLTGGRIVPSGDGPH